MSCSERAGHLALGKEVVAYCPSCGDEAPGIPYTMETLDRAPSQLYLRTSADRFDNLAWMVNCEVPNAPLSLRVEVDHGGLLILPDPFASAAVTPTSSVPITPSLHEVSWMLTAVPALLVGCLLLRRRRRPMRPRAVDLAHR